MTGQQLTSSLEDYLEAIAELTEIYSHAHTKDIADRLGVKMPSVTNALQTLSNMGLIEYRRNYPVELTESGGKLATEILHRHRALKTFFSDILMLDSKESDMTACKIEHIVGERGLERIIILSDRIKNSPECAPLRDFIEHAWSKK